MWRLLLVGMPANQLLTNFGGLARTEPHQPETEERVVAGSVVLNNTAEDRVAQPGTPKRRYDQKVGGSNQVGGSNPSERAERLRRSGWVPLA